MYTIIIYTTGMGAYAVDILISAHAQAAVLFRIVLRNKVNIVLLSWGDIYNILSCQ